MIYNILAVGDVVGACGVKHLSRCLRSLKKRKSIHFTVVNGENAAMVGLTPNDADDIFAAGADVITLGNHTFGKMQIRDYLDDCPYILRPANLGSRVPGRGYAVYDCGAARIAVMNLIGRCDLSFHASNPFTTADELLKAGEKPTFTLVDIFGKPLDASAQTEATEPTETAPSETEPVTEAPTEAPTEEPTEDPNTPRDEDGKPMTLLTKLCLTPSDTAVRLDLDKAVEAAYAYGRGGGLFSRVKKNALTERTDLNVADFLTLDESYVRTMLDEYAKDAVSEKTEPSVTEGTTTVTDDEGEERELKTLTVKLGSAGREINTDELYKAVLTAYADANFEMQYVVEEDLPKAFDLDALYHKYYVAPVNAVCNEDTYEVTDGSDGYGFDIKKAMDELEEMMRSESDCASCACAEECPAPETYAAAKNDAAAAETPEEESDGKPDIEIEIVDGDEETDEDDDEPETAGLED